MCSSELELLPKFWNSNACCTPKVRFQRQFCLRPARTLDDFCTQPEPNENHGLCAVAAIAVCCPRRVPDTSRYHLQNCCRRMTRFSLSIVRCHPACRRSSDHLHVELMAIPRTALDAVPTCDYPPSICLVSHTTAYINVMQFSLKRRRQSSARRQRLQHVRLG